MFWGAPGGATGLSDRLSAKPLMADRLIHQRSKGPVSTPAQRLVELQQELMRAEQRAELLQTKIVDLENQLSRYRSLGGVSFGGIPIAQAWTELILWESLLNDRRFEAVFELGTWQGGFSWWMWAQCKAREMVFHTFDSISPQREMPDYCFTRKDVFAEVEALGALFREHEPCIVFCDNGNKPRELQTFSKELRDPNSLLVAHDWSTEIGPEDVPAGVRMVYEDFCVEIGSMSRVFQLKE